MTDDRALLAELRARRPEAARALYEQYGPGLYAFACRRSGDAQLSREIVQDVMLSVWSAAPRFDESRGSLRSWVFQIARNATIDASRRRNSRPGLLHDVARADADRRDPADDIEVMFRNWLIAEALERLPADHRAVVELVYFQQLKVSEAAAALGIPEGTVKSRCFYALQNLRTGLSELGVINGDL